MHRTRHPLVAPRPNLEFTMHCSKHGNQIAEFFHSIIGGLPVKVTHAKILVRRDWRHLHEDGILNSMGAAVRIALPMLLVDMAGLG